METSYIHDLTKLLMLSVVNWIFQSINEASLDITFTIPFKDQILKN